MPETLIGWDGADWRILDPLLERLDVAAGRDHVDGHDDPRV